MGQSGPRKASRPTGVVDKFKCLGYVYDCNPYTFDEINVEVRESGGWWNIDLVEKTETCAVSEAGPPVPVDLLPDDGAGKAAPVAESAGNAAAASEKGTTAGWVKPDPRDTLV